MKSEKGPVHSIFENFFPCRRRDTGRSGRRRGRLGSARFLNDVILPGPCHSIDRIRTRDQDGIVQLKCCERPSDAASLSIRTFHDPFGVIGPAVGKTNDDLPLRHRFQEGLSDDASIGNQAHTRRH